MLKIFDEDVIKFLILHDIFIIEIKKLSSFIHI
jgi:hypothetical protein